jgi:hypothetical protein
MCNDKILSVICFLFFFLVSTSIQANNNTKPEFNQYIINLYNYISTQQCYMDDITTRDSSLKKSGKIIYWYNGKKREIVDSMVFKIKTTKGVLVTHELSGQISGTYRCLKANNFQSRYMFESRLLKKLDKHTQKKFNDALIRQGKL